jgi:hypothetical protein
MIDCIRLWTNDDELSQFQRGVVDLEPGQRGDLTSPSFAVTTLSFRETNGDGAYGWHTAPTRQFVITLSGRLEFRMRTGDSFILSSGIVLLAEDTTGSGHAWKMIDPEPWRRLYLPIAADAQVPFRANPRPS